MELEKVSKVGTSNPGDLLNKKQKLFVEAYAGNEVAAMQIAGYHGDDNYLRQKARELLRTPKILKALQDRSKYLMNMGQAIASKSELQMLWTSIMNNHDPHRKSEKDANGIPISEGNIPISVRLKASELLAKSEGHMITQIDINHNVTVSDIVKQSYQMTDVPVEVIEAEYRRVKEEKEELISDAKVKEIPTSQPSSLGDLI